MPIDHLAVFLNAVAVLGIDVTLALLRLVRGGRPCQVISSDLDIIVGEFAQLVIIHSEQFGFFRRAEVQTRDVVDDQSKNRRHDESVAGARNNVGDLDVELLVVVIQPASGDETRAHPIQANNPVGGKQGVKEQPDDSCNPVLSEDVNGIIDSDPELD